MNLKSFLISLEGGPQLSDAVPYIPTTDRRRDPGIVVPYMDSVWGGGEVVWAKAAAVIGNFQVCALHPVLGTETFQDGTSFSAYALTATTLLTGTVLLGQTIGIALNPMTVGQYGWFFVTANCLPVQFTALATANAKAYLSATAGKLTSTQVAGYEINAFRSVGTGAETRTATGIGGRVGQPYIQVDNTEGMFLGNAFTGTGVPASQLIASLDRKSVV